MGPSTTPAPLLRASSATASPTAPINSVFQVAARAAPTGKQAAVAPLIPSPRTPLGPSLTFSAGIPSRGTGVVCQGPEPAQSDTFSSRVRAASKFSIRGSLFVMVSDLRERRGN